MRRTQLVALTYANVSGLNQFWIQYVRFISFLHEIPETLPLVLPIFAADIGWEHLAAARSQAELQMTRTSMGAT